MQKIELSKIEDIESGYIIVDARSSEAFAAGFMEGSLSIPFDENFLSSFEELTEDSQKIFLVASETQLPELLKTIRSSALTQIFGYLEGGFDAWQKAGNKTDVLITIDADEFAIDYKFDEFYLVDVRLKEEYGKEHIEDAENITLTDLDAILIEMEPEESYYIYAGTGTQAVTGASILRRNGFHRVRAVAADFETIKASGVPVFVQKKKGNAPTNLQNN